jgi:hypothetical protein
MSAAAELGSEVAIFVELPYAPGWKAAVELVEAAACTEKFCMERLLPMRLSRDKQPNSCRS